jgi:hypothetical protein
MGIINPNEITITPIYVKALSDYRKNSIIKHVLTSDEYSNRYCDFIQNAPDDLQLLLEENKITKESVIELNNSERITFQLITDYCYGNLKGLLNLPVPIATIINAREYAKQNNLDLG